MMLELAPAKDLILRDYQVESIESLRQNMRAGHIRQVLASPTGSGKSVIMLDMVRSAVEKNSRVLFICERRVLVEQFSKHLDSLNIQHGVMMAKHWRYDPQALVQVASAQTLERMQYWPEFEIVFIDELHACLRASIIKMIEARPNARIIGATATPFHPLIPKHFSAVTSVISMRELVEKGNLLPFKVFVAHEIDVEGLKIVAGEFKKDDLEKRGQQIVGDVVSDYVRLSNEIFGGFRKTICFSCGVAHGADLVQRFQEAGVNAIQISYKDTDEYKAEVLADFARPDTEIQMLISTDILGRGFDQTDVEHVILTRAFKKSFSAFVQQVGRGARPHEGQGFCIASGQRVLTHRGLVAIEKVSLYDRLWDGNSFVSHKGVINKGTQHVITYQGLTATPDHRVKTAQGWRTLGYCSEKQIPIVQTGFGRHPIRESKNIFSGCGVERETLAAADARPLRMSNVFQKISDFIQQSVARAKRRLLQMQPAKDRHQQIGSSEGCRARTALYEPECPPLLRLRRAWNSIQIRECFGWLFVGHGEFAVATGFEEIPTGPNRQRRALRAGQSPVGDTEHESVAHSTAHAERPLAFIQDRKSNNSLCGSNTKESIQCGADERSDHREIPQAIVHTKRQVWDILDSGPNNCFTCEGLLVHNCVVQDHSGNWLRFQESWDEFYENGVKELTSDQDDKPRKEKTKSEKAAATCPRCSAIWPAKTDVCSHCGHVRERKSSVVAVPGRMNALGELDLKPRRDFYAGLLTYAKEHGYKPGWAFFAYQEKYPGAKPPPLTTCAPFVSDEVRKWVQHRNIRNAKRRITA